ncbi:NAD(P)H-dependent oxidoreductase [Candidatus Woesebacteria bacterium]|nr:NAD(P)H-dependent oxidoreductase [Candidatus Woesebacteria bacterium]
MVNHPSAMEEALNKALHWRYATKKFDPSKKLSDQTLNALLESLRLAPSSSGLQPWKFLVVTNPGVRKQIKEVAHEQLQIVDASHLIVLTRPLHIDVDLVDRHIANTARIRGVTVDSMAKYRNTIVNSIRSKTSENLISWATAQIYIALGFLLESAALLGVDACPMEGFDKDKLDGVLGLSEKGLASAVICALGYRSEEDKYASIQKSRFTREEMFEFIV